MTSITPRVPQLDWTQGFARRWNHGDPAATHAFNALSFLFPQGERFFIETAREVAAGLDLPPELGARIQGFVTQESLHTREHGRYNEVLRAQGFANVVHGFIEWLQARARRRVAPLTRLAVVCAYEHYTAILGHWLLSHPAAIDPGAPDLALIWGWHSVEEIEHKAVCFDLYRAAGGGPLRRLGAFAMVSLVFSGMFARLYLSLLYRDGCLRPSRWAATTGGVLRFFFGRGGVGWALLTGGLHYLRPRFHPADRDDQGLMDDWLARHRGLLRAHGGA